MTTKFLDIFSRKKSVIKPRVKGTITIDHREKNCLIPSKLKELGFNTKFENLKVADYIIKGVAIERKTVSDFISSTINKRLLKQVEELKQYQKKLLIIEGIGEQELYNDDKQNQLGMHPNAIRGLLLSILLKHQIPIIFTKNYKDTVKFMSVLSKKKKTEMPLNINKKNLTNKQRLQFTLESFPGIGPKTAKTLLKKFNTLQKIFIATEEELKEVIGKKAETLKKIIDMGYSNKK